MYYELNCDIPIGLTVNCKYIFYLGTSTKKKVGEVVLATIFLENMLSLSYVFTIVDVGLLSENGNHGDQGGIR
jgi:hypothetical protein